MSGLEREELETVIKGMSREQQETTAAFLPDDIILQEVCARYTDMQQKLHNLGQAFAGKEERC